MPSYLVTYRPISATGHGRRAVEAHGIPPFVDASCRREPDLESPYPAISALCRGRLFVPRLAPGDRVVYLSKKGRYGRELPRHWRFVAVLRVLERFESHEKAAGWYRERGLEPPRNCMAEGSSPLPLGQTGGTKAVKVASGDPETIVRLWNAGYRKRARACGVILATEPLYLDVHDPPAITEEQLEVFGGRMPCTQNPPRIADEVVGRLLAFAGRRVA